MREAFTPEFADTVSQAIRDARGAAFSYRDGPPSEESVFYREHLAIEAMPQAQRDVWSRLTGNVLSAARLAQASLHDHLNALENDVARKPPAVWTPLMIARGVAESVALGCYLINPAVDLETRIARAAGLLVTEADNAFMADKTLQPSTTSNRQQVIEEMARGGITITGDPGRTKVTIGATSVPADFKVSEEVRRHLAAGAPQPYRLMSGAAHVRPWLLSRTATPTADGFEGEAATVSAAAFIAMLELEFWVREWTGYFGLDGSGALAALRAVANEFGRKVIRQFPLDA